MWAGTRRLLLLTVPSVARYVHDRLGNAARLALSAAPHGSVAAVLDDAIVAAVDALMAEAGGPAWDEAGFARLRDHVAGALADRTAAVVAHGRSRCSTPPARFERLLEPLTAVPLQPARADVRAQLAPARPPGLHRRHRRRAAAGRRALPAGRRAPARAPARRRRRRPRPHERDPRARARLPRAAGRGPGRAPGCARCRGCSRSCASASSPRRSARAAPISAKRIRRALAEASAGV